MFDEVAVWCSNTTNPFACCHNEPTSPRHMHPSELKQGAVLKATKATLHKAHATTPRRCSSGPEQAQSIALRHEQHELEGKLAGVNQLYAHVFSVPSSHPCSFVIGRIYRH